MFTKLNSIAIHAPALLKYAYHAYIGHKRVLIAGTLTCLLLTGGVVLAHGLYKKPAKSTKAALKAMSRRLNTPYPTKTAPAVTHFPTQAPTATPTTAPTVILQATTAPTAIPTPTITPMPTARVPNPPRLHISFPTEGQSIELNNQQTFCVVDVPDEGGDNTGLKRREKINESDWSGYTTVFTLCYGPREGQNSVSLQYSNSYGEESPVYSVNFNFHRISE